MIEINAPAKINLSLYILGRRPDGYHDVVTQMQKLDLCDRIRLELNDSAKIEFCCDDPSLPAGEDNLAVKAAAVFFSIVDNGGSTGVSIGLQKQIPVAAGLGGGSSDAGAVLNGLNKLLGYPCSEKQLLDLAKTLGADVPFFVARENAVRATGIGDCLSAAPSLDGYWVMLVNPGISVSTRWAFENYALTTVPKNSKMTGFCNVGNSSFSPGMMHNDLELVTMSHYPVVGYIKQTLLDSGAVASMMSGSGPTVFGLFVDDDCTEKEQNRLVDRLSSMYGSRVYLTHTYTGA